MINSALRYLLLEESVEKLNIALKADALGVTAFFRSMTACDKSVGEGDIEVMTLGHDLYALSPLGLLNGIVACGEDKGHTHRMVYFLDKGSGLISRFDIHTMLTDVNSVQPDTEGVMS